MTELLNEIKKQGSRFLPALSAPLGALLVQPVVTNYFIYELRFHGVFSRNNLSRIRDGVYVINLDEKKSTVYFNSFEIEYITEKNIKQNKIKIN